MFWRPKTRDGRTWYVAAYWYEHGESILLRSTDGRAWTRHRGANGRSRVFLAPGQVRDPVLIKISDRWHMYYAGHHGNDERQRAFYLRTSSDLIHWSDWSIAHFDVRGPYGDATRAVECPHVVQRGDYYYLLRTESYSEAVCHVFRSEDPADFGIAAAQPDQHKGGGPEENSRIALDILRGEKGARRDVVVLNAAAAIVVAELATTIGQGMELAP